MLPERPQMTRVVQGNMNRSIYQLIHERKADLLLPSEHIGIENPYRLGTADAWALDLKKVQGEA